MLSLAEKLRIAAAGAALTVLAGSPALADDSEIYRSQADTVGVQPNVLFVIDTSGSMDTEVVVETYDPTRTYTGTCGDPSRIYFSLSDERPACDTTNYFASASNVCSASLAALGTGGAGLWPAEGATLKRLAQLRKKESGENGSGTLWRTLSTTGGTGNVECLDDNGTHGGTTGSNKVYISNTDSTGFNRNDSGLWDNLRQGYRLYSANYINYLNNPVPVIQTRFQIVRDVAINLTSTLKDVNLGLMRYSWDPDKLIPGTRNKGVADGGYVWVPVAPIATNRANILNTLQPLGNDYGEGNTPLSETLYEAALYLKGKPADFGKISKPGTSAAASMKNGTYISPIVSSCQKSFVVYLTDGLPTSDSDANDKIASMVGKSSCSGDGTDNTIGICTDDLAYHLAHTDQSSKTGDQFIKTYMIGFGEDVKESKGFLDGVAKAGDTGTAYTASDAGTLTTALQSIFQDIQTRGGTFVTPAVTINAFNRNQTSDDVYLSLFQSAPSERWTGNVKKFKNRNGQLVYGDEKAPKAAIDPDGYFADAAQDYWSSSADGADINKGGATGVLKAPADRNLLTFLKNAQGAYVSTPLLPKNAKYSGQITDAMVGTATSTTACSQSCEDAVNWARGYDVYDLNKDNNKYDTSTQRFLGDPLHGRIATVTYGGTATQPDSVVFTPTNDGFLHAFRADTGVEMWGFIPPELLPRLSVLKQNPTSTTRGYGLDGDIKVLRYDKNQNGVIELNDDFVWLFFGMRSGGNHYYALDVSDKANPKMLWNIGPDQLPGVGQTWSPPAITRVNVKSGNSDANKFVLIFGGGYDPRQESPPYATDTVGNRIYMVDAKTGSLLWYAGGPGTGTPKLSLDEMNNSIPAPISVIDSNGDGFADRMYAGDMGGRVWRFDIFNGKESSSLVTGGVFARLGAGVAAGASAGTPAQSTVRRFYNAPDVSLIQQGDDDPYYNVAIGSGYRGHPLNKDTNDAFYSLRDKRPFAQMAKTDWDAYKPITESDTGLIDISANPLGTSVSTAARGWKYHFTSANPGEKVLAPSTTFNNVVMFNSYQPSDGSSDSCYPTSKNRVYALYASSGKPALDINKDGEIKNDDVSKTLAFTNGIAGGVTVGVDFSSAVGTPPGGTNPTTPVTPGGGVPVCRSALEVVQCPQGTGANRTFWKRKDAR